MADGARRDGAPPRPSLARLTPTSLSPRDHLDAADAGDAGEAFTAPLRPALSAAVGAPASDQVCEGRRGGSTMAAAAALGAADRAHLPLQESRETLARLKRMAGFEAQDFDPIVSGRGWWMWGGQGWRLRRRPPPVSLDPLSLTGQRHRARVARAPHRGRPFRRGAVGVGAGLCHRRRDGRRRLHCRLGHRRPERRPLPTGGGVHRGRRRLLGAGRALRGGERGVCGRRGRARLFCRTPGRRVGRRGGEDVPQRHPHPRPADGGGMGGGWRGLVDRGRARARPPPRPPSDPHPRRQAGRRRLRHRRRPHRGQRGPFRARRRHRRRRRRGGRLGDALPRARPPRRRAARRGRLLSGRRRPPGFRRGRHRGRRGDRVCRAGRRPPLCGGGGRLLLLDLHLLARLPGHRRRRAHPAPGRGSRVPPGQPPARALRALPRFRPLLRLARLLRVPHVLLCVGRAPVLRDRGGGRR